MNQITDTDRAKVVNAMGGRLTANDDAIINRVAQLLVNERAASQASRDAADLNALRLHIVSEHANGAGLEQDLASALEYHDNEHRGPCTIRNHDAKSLHWNAASVAEVLAETLEVDEKSIRDATIREMAGICNDIANEFPGIRSGVAETCQTRILLQTCTPLDLLMLGRWQ